MREWMTTHPKTASLCYGAAGFLACWICWHLYLDHRQHHLLDQQIGIWQRQAVDQAKPGGS